MALNPQTGLQQFGFFKKIAKKLLKPAGGSKFIKKTLMPPGMKKSLEYSLLPHKALGMSERDLLMPHKALGMSGRDLLMPQIPRGGRGPREGRPPHKDLPSGFNPFRLEGRPIRRPRLEGRPRKDLPRGGFNPFGLGQRMPSRFPRGTRPYFPGQPQQDISGILDDIDFGNATFDLKLTPWEYGQIGHPEGRPRKDLPKWLQGKFGGIGGLREKLLNVPFFEGRQFPTGIPEQLRQLPLAPPEWDQRMELYQQPAPIPTGIPEQLEQFGHGGTVVPRDPQQPAPINQFGGTVVPRAPVDTGYGWDVDRWLPIAPRLSPEEITQQRIDQVSQFEQEPMMRAQYEPLGGYADGGIAELLHYYGV